jgi:hypothetical protein
VCKKEGGIKRKNRGYKGTKEEKKQRLWDRDKWK